MKDFRSIDMRVVIDGKFPNMNDLIKESRTNKYGANKLKKRAMNNIIYQLQPQIQNKLEVPIFLDITFFEPNRRRDKDNVSGAFMKFFLDALQEGGWISNDGWKEVAGWTHIFEVDAEHPRIEIEIKEEHDEERK